VEPVLVEADVGPYSAMAGVPSVEEHKLQNYTCRRPEREEIALRCCKSGEHDVPDNLRGNRLAQVSVWVSIAFELTETFAGLTDQVTESWLIQSAVCVSCIDC
jgi:hypothetical protein